MRARDALKLRNRDQVEVRTNDGWVMGYVLGDPRKEHSFVVIPVQTPNEGYQEVVHTDVR